MIWIISPTSDNRDCASGLLSLRKCPSMTAHDVASAWRLIRIAPSPVAILTSPPVHQWSDWETYCRKRFPGTPWFSLENWVDQQLQPGNLYTLLPEFFSRSPLDAAL